MEIFYLSVGNGQLQWVDTEHLWLFSSNGCYDNVHVWDWNLIIPQGMAHERVIVIHQVICIGVKWSFQC